MRKFSRKYSGFYMNYLGNTKKYERHKRKVGKKYIYLRILLVIVILVFVFVGCADKTPDLVATINSMNYEYCSVIAYEYSWVDKEQLANRLIEMCKENAFKSIKFATDVRGYSTGIYMNVYLNRWNFKRGEIFMKVKYLPADNNWIGNIRDYSGNYVLNIDGDIMEK